jgi:DNA-binding transcriptional regulator GbsR (MarR family)
MNNEERINKQKELVEFLGRHFDKEGYQPIAGRIMGLLMVMDKEQYTFDEIVEELQISKSSASNALRNLEIRGMIEYITLPGDRRRYFQIKRSKPFSIIEDMEEKMSNMLDMISLILDLKENKGSRNSVFIREFSEVITYILSGLKEMKKDYIAEKD